MSIQHMDNFSMYGTNPNLMLQGVWAEVQLIGQTVNLIPDPDAAAAAAGSIVLAMTGQTATLPVVRYVLNTAEPVCGIALRFWADQLPFNDFDRPNIMEWRDASNNVYAYLILETTGRITFNWEGGSFTTVNPVITAGGWYHMEAKYDTTGTGGFELRIEGVTVISETGLAYAGHGSVYQVSMSYNATNFGASTVNFKDFVVWDGSGAQNNNFLGAVVIYSLEPVADQALNWTPTGAANGFSILDNNPPNDAEYIAAPFPIPAAYQATLSQLPPDITSVKAIMPMVRASKTDGGDGFLQTSVISDPAAPATGNGANRPITTAQTYWRDIFEVDPKTAAPWLPSSVNSVVLQINRTA